MQVVWPLVEGRAFVVGPAPTGWRDVCHRCPSCLRFGVERVVVLTVLVVVSPSCRVGSVESIDDTLSALHLAFQGFQADMGQFFSANETFPRWEMRFILHYRTLPCVRNRPTDRHGHPLTMMGIQVHYLLETNEC
ncbi:hypothetical protein BDM02DRAFT_1316794 [Thelephora ganbajun]|uniref:Uncharacterized protein n=1 Tax=Thelephora ganbajun TaxID=370292 RepID=A0ACB6Z2P8_THEGA|nr:hypothetical protein BDM02DRAFT_1316794 [Thelephora ganbajun]